MKDNNNFGAQKLTSQSIKIEQTKKILKSKNSFASVSNRHAQLEAVKNTAELWLQADLDNRSERKLKLETELEEALAGLEQHYVLPIMEIFKRISYDSRLNAR